MELRDLRYFCMVVETGNVTAAALRLGTSQPFLTKVIRQIEVELDGQLFKKSGRYIVLNELGEAFYSRAKKVLFEMDNLCSEMSYLMDKPGKTITLLSNTEAYSPDLILNFNKINLNYSIAALYASRDEIIKSLKTESGTCALCCPPIPADISNDIATENAFYDVGQILLPPRHPLLDKKKITVDDFRKLKLVTSPKGSALRCVVEPLFAFYGIEMDIVCESNNLNVLTRAVENGMGFAFMPSRYLNNQPDLYKYIVDIDAPEEQKHVYFGLSYNKKLRENPYFEHFRSFVLEYFSEF